MGFIEALVMLSVGVFAGILSTVFDVLVMGSASFLSHFALWVLFNALLASHVESRLRAILWAIPFNFGYIEAYFMTTVASFESYQKALMVPLAAVALISPLLNYALWTAKKEKNVYGRVLSIAIVAGTLVSSYLVNNQLGVYDFVVCAILAYVLMAMPTRRLMITRGTRPYDPAAQEAAEAAAAEAAARRRTGDKNSSRKPRGKFGLGVFGRDNTKPKHARRDRNVVDEPMPEVGVAATNSSHESQAVRPTARTGEEAKSKPRRFSLLHRRSKRRQEDDEREKRLRAASERRARRRSEAEQSQGNGGLATLGNARQARRSSRS